MKKWLKKRLIGVILMGTALISSAPQIAQANGNGGISVCSLYTEYSNTTLSITDNTAKMTVRVRGIAGVTTKIHAKVTLQKYSNGSWKAVKAYEDSVSTYTYSMSKNKAVSKGKYRIKGVYTVYKGSKSEKITQFSRSVTCN